MIKIFTVFNIGFRSSIGSNYWFQQICYSRVISKNFEPTFILKEKFPAEGIFWNCFHVTLVSYSADISWILLSHSCKMTETAAWWSLWCSEGETVTELILNFSIKFACVSAFKCPFWFSCMKCQLLLHIT